MSKYEHETGMERLRRAVRILDNCREDWLDQFSAPDLLKIVEAHLRGTWDVYPDEWSPRQVHEAIRHGVAPRFREDSWTGRLVPVHDGIYAVELERRGGDYVCRIWRDATLMMGSGDYRDAGSAVRAARSLLRVSRGFGRKVSND